MAQALALQSDGKIVVAGSSGGNMAVARYSVSGVLDTSFDGDGVALAGTSGRPIGAFAVAIQKDDRIVAAGDGSDDFVVVRFNPTGSLDVSFGGGDGIVTTDFGSFSNQENGRAIALQPRDGRLVVAGRSDRGEFAVARYHGFDCNGSGATIVGTNGPDSLVGLSFTIPTTPPKTFEFDDVIVGLGGADTIDGRGGNDIICGGNGGDTINGGSGDDTLFGESGTDQIDGGSGTDACDVGFEFGTNPFNPPPSPGTTQNCESSASSGSGFSCRWVSDVTQSCPRKEKPKKPSDCVLEGVLEISNPGINPTRTATVRFFRSEDEFLDSADAVILETQVYVLEPGEARELDFFVTLAPGDDVMGEFVIALLDADNEVAEIHEDNNVIPSTAIVHSGKGPKGH